ncbi:MAG: thermonuclease family protein [Chloroflexota bacterium]
MRIDGVIQAVRYIGIDAPERADYYAYQSTQRNIQLVEGKWITLVKDVSETDRFDRLLRYVLVGSTFVNQTLVREGFATAKDYPPDTACSSVFTSAQSLASGGDTGMWKATPTQGYVAPPPPLPQPTSKQATPQPTQSGNCHPSYPTVCIPPPPPDLNCKDIPYRRFTVLKPDPHGFDGDNDGVGCESG